MANYRVGGGMGSIPPVLRTILIINVVVFIAQQVMPAITEWGSLHYWTSTGFKPHQIVTMMFMHGSIGHIFFNMFSLYIFGSILENYWGGKRFFNFYMICGIIASIITLLSVPFSGAQYIKFLAAHGQDVSIEQYMQDYGALGASGAIMGVMAAFAYLFPNTEMYMMFIPIPIKAKYLVPGFIAIDLFGGLGYAFQGDNVAHWAHVGGALAGLIIVFIWNKTNKKDFY